MTAEISFGRWLQKRRKALDLTREELAHKIGCSASALRKIEADVRHPSKQLAESLACALDIPPGERVAFARIARGELALERMKFAAPPVPSLAQPSQAVSPHIPIPPTPLIGRESEMAALRKMLDDSQCRLITLIGPGGIGKTRLAMEIACDTWRNFKDGVAFVALAGLNSPSLILPAIADSLGFTFQGTIDPQKQLMNFLCDRQILLVLDNAEHLLDDVSVVAKIIQSAASVKILCTSREPLNLRCEWLFEVRGLPLPQSVESIAIQQNSAVTLFLQRANQVKPLRRLNHEDRAAVLHICNMVEGIPLAIELSAVWTKTLSCGEIAREIEKNLDFLSTNMRDLPERHRSLRAVFNHSWNLLTEEERNVLMKLSVFQGGFKRELAEQVANANVVVLSALVMKSLIQHVVKQRYSLHDMVRQYAFAQLQSADQVQQTYSAHLRAFADLAEALEPDLTRSGQSRQLMYVETEYENFLVALRWAIEAGDGESALRLTGALWRYWYMRSHLVEGSQWLERALQVASSDAPAALRVKVLNGLGLLAYYQGRYDYAKQMLEECLALQSNLAEHDIAYAQLTLALVVHDQLDFSRASILYKETLQRFRRLNDSYGMIRTLNCQGALAFDEEELDLAEKLFHECLALARQHKDKENVAVALTNLGWTAAVRGDEKAVELCQEAVTLFCDLGNKLGIAFSLEGVAAGFVLLGQTDRAVRLLGSANSLRKVIDAPVSGTHARCLEKITQQARNALSNMDFTVVWIEGESMSMEKAIEYAIGITDIMNTLTDASHEEVAFQKKDSRESGNV